MCRGELIYWLAAATACAALRKHPEIQSLTGWRIDLGQPVSAYGTGTGAAVDIGVGRKEIVIGRIVAAKHLRNLIHARPFDVPIGVQ